MAIKNKLPFFYKLMDAYNQYRSFGYPISTKVYVINCSADTLKLITNDLSNRNYTTFKMDLKEKAIKIEEDKLLVDDSYFSIKINNHLELGRIVFGPQQLEFTLGD